MRYLISLLLFAVACDGIDIEASTEVLELDTGDLGEEFRSVIQYSVSEGYDKCCPTNTDAACTNDVSNACPGGKVLTGCMECNTAKGPSVGWAGPWEGPHACDGLSWRISTGVMLDDDCSVVGDLANTDVDDPHFCSNDPWPDYNYACNGGVIDALYAQTNGMDGGLGSMCCKPSAQRDNGQVCMLWDGLCSISGPQDYDQRAYCLPCPGYTSVDAGSGGWDLVAVAADDDGCAGEGCGGPPGEWGASMDCGEDGTFWISGTANPPGGDCRIAAYECGGILVDGNTGALISEDCSGWP